MERVSRIAKRVQVGKPQASRDESRAERLQFSDELQHVADAYRHELVDEVIRVYWQALKAIPVEIRTTGLTQCLQRLKFFPTVAEVLTACADVVDERRKALAKENERVKAECPIRLDGRCDGNHRETHGGVIRCECHKRGLALLASSDQPITRPALPASTEVEP